MSSTINVTVHASQFPPCVKETLLEGLRLRRIAPKFHYQSYKQAQLWLALHRAHSPACLDPDCELIYHQSFVAAAGLIQERRVEVIGLGCGGGEKEARLLSLLATLGKELSYVPCDVSWPLVLTAVRAAQSSAIPVSPVWPCRPLVCDLALAPDLPDILDSCGEPEARRIITFFGIIPNFEPDDILPKLVRLVRAQDLLLFSANLAPGPDYLAGVRQVLPGYDNAETRVWLRAFLEDLGVEPSDGVVDFSVEEGAGGRRRAADDLDKTNISLSSTNLWRRGPGRGGSPLPNPLPAGAGRGDEKTLLSAISPKNEMHTLRRIVADFRFLRDRVLTVQDEVFAFHAGEAVRLFFSCRYTPDLVRQFLQAHGLQVVEQWITKSEEEGVFLCRKGDCSS